MVRVWSFRSEIKWAECRKRGSNGESVGYVEGNSSTLMWLGCRVRKRNVECPVLSVKVVPVLTTLPRTWISLLGMVDLFMVSRHSRYLMLSSFWNYALTALKR